jgi:hypothetical protein
MVLPETGWPANTRRSPSGNYWPNEECVVSGLAESPRLRLGEAPRREGPSEREFRTLSRMPRDSERYCQGTRPTIAGRFPTHPPERRLAVVDEMTPATVSAVCVQARSVLMSPELPRGRAKLATREKRLLTAVRATFGPCRFCGHSVESADRWLRVPMHRGATSVRSVWAGT